MIKNMGMYKYVNGNIVVASYYFLNDDIPFRLKDLRTVKEKLGYTDTKMDNTKFTYNVLQPLFKDFSSFDIKEFLYNGRNTMFIVTFYLKNGNDLYEKLINDDKNPNKKFEPDGYADIESECVFTPPYPAELQDMYNKLQKEIMQFFETIMKD